MISSRGCNNRRDVCVQQRGTQLYLSQQTIGDINSKTTRMQMRVCSFGRSSFAVWGVGGGLN